MKTLFTDLQTKLLELTIGSDTATENAFLRHVDLDTGQLDQFSQRPPVAFPCALIDISMPTIKDMSEDSKTQRGTVQGNIRLAWDFSGHTSEKTSAAHLAQGLKYLEQVEYVTELLQGFKLDHARSRMTNTSWRTERRADRYKVVNLPFSWDVVREFP